MNLEEENQNWEVCIYFLQIYPFCYFFWDGKTPLMSMKNKTFHLFTYLNEANFLGIAAEALPAAHEPILADQAMRVTTHATAKITSINA